MTDLLYPHQVTARQWLRDRPVALLADEPGLGKTVSAIQAADAVGAGRVLIVCPAIAQAHWREHMDRWQQIQRTCIDPEGMPPLTHEYRVISYDKLSRWEPDRLWPLCKEQWDVLILDEAHYLKSSGSKRTRRVYGPKCDGVRGLVGYCDRTWILTGTPCPNHVGELWTHMRGIFQCPMDEDTWLNKFCHQRQTTYGMQVTGHKNLEQLKPTLAQFMLRRKTQDVMDLPPLRFEIETLPWSSATPASKTLFNQIRDTWDGQYPTPTEDDEHIATLRRKVGVAKIPMVVEYIRDALDGNQRKMLCFAWHREVIEALDLALQVFNPVVIHGGTSEGNRQQAITAFQGDPDVRLFIGQIKACGTAITLTAAQDVVFAESDWTPENNYQAVKRAHRIGQTSSVLARHLVVEDTFETILHRILVRKERELAGLMKKGEAA